MDGLYKLCKQCKQIKVDYSQMWQQDKQPLIEAAEHIVEYYRDMLYCTNNWYAMTRDITISIKALGYGYHLELDNEVLVIEVCETSIVQLG